MSKTIDLEQIKAEAEKIANTIGAEHSPRTEKIGKLLKQAEKAGTEKERETYCKKAYDLASQSNIDLAVALAAASKGEKREEPCQRRVSFGALATKNAKKHLVELYSAVARNNGLQLNIFHNSTGVILFGFPSDMEVADLLFGSLATQMVDAGNKYIAKGDYKAEKVWREKRVKVTDYWDCDRWEFEGGYFPVDGRTARLEFYQGFIARVSGRLSEARREAEQARIQEEQEQRLLDAPEAAQEPSESTSTALAIVAKREQVRDYYKKTSTARGSWKGASSGSSSSSGYSAGSVAGARARLTGTKAIGGAKTGIGR